MTIYFYHVMMYDVLVYAVVTTLKKNKSQAWCGWWESNPQNTGFEPVVCQFYYIHRSSVRAIDKAERIAQGVSDKENLEWRCCPDGWCKRRDSNPYANAAASKTAMSAYSITLA